VAALALPLYFHMTKGETAAGKIRASKMERA